MVASLVEHGGFLVLYFFRCETPGALNLKLHRVVEKETVSYGLHLEAGSINGSQAGEVFWMLAF